MIKHSDIPCFKDTSIDINLAKAIKVFQPNNLLEVGVGLGSSTWNILDNITDTEVYVLDNFAFSPEPYRLKKIKKCKHYYKLAVKDKQIVDNHYDHYNLFCWLIKKHNRSCTIIKEDINKFIKTETNYFDFVYLDNQKHLNVLYSQLDFFRKSKIICGTGYTLKQNKKDIKKFVKNNNLLLSVDRDFYLINNVGT